MSKRAVILAGGKGTRLLPFTVVLPKPLMPVGEYPILEIVVRQLAKNGFGHITLAVNHLAEIIMSFFGDGSKWGIRIDYSLEEKPLGTMGPLKRIHDLPEHFLIMNGDVLTDLDFTSFYNRHVSDNELFTVCAYRKRYKIDYGVLDVNSEGYLKNFTEKPETEYQISSGIYMASRRILELIPDNRTFGFDHLMIEMIQKGTPARISPFDGKWLDIGSPDDYLEASKLFDSEKELFV